MSPRIKLLRKVLNPPIVKGFLPYGNELKEKSAEPVYILIEEYEALRLCDFDMYNHHQSSEIMNISRPTFTRIYASARQKIARAFVEGKKIVIEGGKVYFDTDWYSCKSCKCHFNNPEKEKKIESCPLCGKKEFDPYDYSENTEKNNDLCVCTKCGSEFSHHPGEPCNSRICPECNIRLIRKRK